MDNIKNLDVNEEKLRDLYLRDLLIGKVQGPLTGFPDKDKPWLKFYSEDAILSCAPNKTMYQFLYENNKDHLSDIAISYFGLKITYGELFENIDLIAKSLIANGIGKGDSVAISAPTTPESLYMLYALNKIGAIVNVIDLRKKSDEIEHCIKLSKVKMLVVYDGQLERIGGIAKKCGVKKTLSLSPTVSFPQYKQCLADPKQFFTNLKYSKDKNKDFMLYDEFIACSKNVDFVPENEFNPNECSLIVYTSGSTGMPKAIKLTDGTANSIVNQYMYNGMIYDRGDKYLNVIPVFLAFGIVLGSHLPLCMGMETSIVPAFDIKKTINYIRQSDPNHVAITPSACSELVESKRFNKLNLSKVRTIGCGGDGFSAKQENRLNNDFSERGFMYHIAMGYGGSEVGSAFSTQTPYVHKDGSVGIPLPGNNVMIINHESGERLGYNQIGDVLMIVDYPMLEYVENENLTNETKLELEDGRFGVKLKDAGYVDEDGYLFLKGRYEDAIYDNNGCMIWPVDIEDAIYSLPFVRQCAVASDGKNGFKLYLTIKNSFKNKPIDKTSIDYVLKDFVPNLEYSVFFLNDMPLTSNGKVDRKTLKELNKDNIDEKILRKI